MEGKKEKTGNIPKYEQIAADIAYQIVEGTYKEGEKFMPAPLSEADIMFHQKLPDGRFVYWQIGIL